MTAMRAAALESIVSTDCIQQAPPRDDKEIPEMLTTLSIAGKELGKLPQELEFLNSSGCNPDLTDENVMVIGNIRNKKSESFHSKTGQAGCIQNVVACLVYSWPFQGLIFVIIMFDLTMMFLALNQLVSDESKMQRITNIVIAVALSVDVLLRFFVEKRKFVRSLLNLFELALVPIMFVEILLHANMPVPALRAVRPILRTFRLLRVLIRTAGKGKAYFIHLRHQASGDRVRFIREGFDLDLAYVHQRMIAMSIPATGRNAILRNPVHDVARFMNEKHGNRYLIVNTLMDCPYKTTAFFDRYLHFPIHQGGVPVLKELLHLCYLLDCFLAAHPENVVAVHSQNAQGRTAIVILSLMIYRGDHRTLTAATAHFERSRMNPAKSDTGRIQTTDAICQQRFLEYFAHALRLSSTVPEQVRPARLKRIQLLGVQKPETLDILVYTHPGGLTERGLQCQSQERRSLSAKQARHMEEEGEQEEEEIKQEIEKDRGGMLRLVQDILEESFIDSFKAGARPLVGKPILSSCAGCRDPRASNRVISGSAPDQHVNTRCVWEFTDAELTDEICFEIHRSSLSTYGTYGNAEKISWSKRLRRFLRACSARKQRWGRPHFQGGMLFTSWLHMGLLENDEAIDHGAGRLNQSAIHVMLDRHHLDKACGAPPMRSYSPTLKLMFEFEVDKRVELIPLNAEDEDQCLLSSAIIQSEEEGLNWLTHVARNIWPSFVSGFQKLIHDGLESARPSLPSLLRNMTLSQCSFGDAFPQFGPISASSRHHEGLEVQLDIGVLYETETNIVLDAGFAEFGISWLKLQGLLSVKFKPILHELPVLAALQLLFVNPPTIELRFTRALEIANSSIIHNAIHGMISKALSDSLVLPNVININWGDPRCDDTISFQNLLPANVVRVSIVEGRGLQAQSSIFSHRPLDSYVKVSIGASATHTKTAMRTSDPVWEEEFEFIIYDPRQHIQIEVVAVDFAMRSSSIGKVHISVVDAAETGSVGKWLQLTNCPENATSEVLIRVLLQEIRVDAGKLRSYANLLNPQERLSVSLEASNASGIMMGDATPDTVLDTEAVGSDDSDLIQCCSSLCGNQAGAIALLVITVFGGRCSPSFGAPSSLCLAAWVGKASAKQPCVESQQSDTGSLSEKAQKSIKKFADMGLRPAQIAHALEEDIQEIERAVRKHGWNMTVAQKLNVLIHPTDLGGTQLVHFNLLRKKKIVAKGVIPISNILRQNISTKYCGVVELHSTNSDDSATVDLELRMFVLVGVQNGDPVSPTPSL